MSRLVRSALATGVGAVLALGAAAPVTTSASAAPAPVVAAAPAPQVPAAAPGRTKGKDLRRVVYVGNNWDGTADVLLPGSFRRIGRLDIVPDYDERIAEISLNPTGWSTTSPSSSSSARATTSSWTTCTPPTTDAC
ncbi:MAG: hypothetical protein ACPF9W_05235 [Nocardioides sp.]